jgi:hypothetical protein
VTNAIGAQTIGCLMPKRSVKRVLIIMSSVNSADPGFTATGLNGHRGTQTIPEGAAEAIRLALLPDNGPTGTYSDRKGVVPW